VTYFLYGWRKFAAGALIAAVYVVLLFTVAFPWVEQRTQDPALDSGELFEVQSPGSEAPPPE
jgi:hypothetical protein